MGGVVDRVPHRTSAEGRSNKETTKRKRGKSNKCGPKNVRLRSDKGRWFKVEFSGKRGWVVGRDENS